jgi:hypothetical protein
MLNFMQVFQFSQFLDSKWMLDICSISTLLLYFTNFYASVFFFYSPTACTYVDYYFLQTSSISLRLSYLGQDFIFPGPELRLLTDVDLNLDLKHTGLRIRIPIGSGFNRVIGSGSGFGIWIRIQEGKNDPQK